MKSKIYKEKWAEATSREKMNEYIPLHGKHFIEVAFELWRSSSSIFRVYFHVPFFDLRLDLYKANNMFSTYFY